MDSWSEFREFSKPARTCTCKKESICNPSSVFNIKNLYMYVHYEQTRKLQSTRMVELVAYVYLLSIYMNNWVYFSKALIFTCNGTSDKKKHNSR